MKIRTVLLACAMMPLVAAPALAADTTASNPSAPAQKPNPVFNATPPGTPTGTSGKDANASPLVQKPARTAGTGAAPSAPTMSTALPAPPDENNDSKTIANVVIPNDVKVDGKQLLLNGAGLYKRWWVMKQYVAALYLTDTATSTASVVVTPGPKRIALHMLRTESDHSLASALTDEMVDNSTATDIDKLSPQIKRFQHLLDGVHPGDEVDFDYLPGKGIRVSIDGKARGSVQGEDFERALLRVWLGKDPVNDDLKQDLLAASSAPPV